MRVTPPGALAALWAPLSASTSAGTAIPNANSTVTMTYVSRSAARDSPGVRWRDEPPRRAMSTTARPTTTQKMNEGKDHADGDDT